MSAVFACDISPQFALLEAPVSETFLVAAFELFQRVRNGLPLEGRDAILKNKTPDIFTPETTVVVVENGEVVGTGLLTVPSTCEEPYEIGSLAVNPNRRGAGVGVLIYDYARTRTGDNIFAEIAQENHPSIAAAHKAGYRCERTFTGKLSGKEIGVYKSVMR